MSDMGMFDEIIVPGSYLRNLLDKEDEKLAMEVHNLKDDEKKSRSTQR